jgi:hypothetical protein
MASGGVRVCTIRSMQVDEFIVHKFHQLHEPRLPTGVSAIAICRFIGKTIKESAIKSHYFQSAQSRRDFRQVTPRFAPRIVMQDARRNM